MKSLLYAFAVCVLLVGAGTTVRAEDATGLRADLIAQVDHVQKQILDLENAIPDGKMTYRPTKEVRSVSEVYAHIAFGNYLFAKIAGVALPEGISIGSADDETKWDKASIDKKVIHDQLVKSFEFVKTSIGNMSDAKLDEMVDFFGQKMTVRGLMLGLLSHMHEHLGQSIAYARIVGVVPPWTAAQLAADKAKK